MAPHLAQHQPVSGQEKEHRNANISSLWSYTPFKRVQPQSGLCLEIEIVRKHYEQSWNDFQKVTDIFVNGEVSDISVIYYWFIHLLKSSVYTDK